MTPPGNLALPPILVRAGEVVAEEDVCIEVVPWRISAGDRRVSGPSIPGSHSAGVREVFAGLPGPGSGHLPLPDPHRLRREAASWRRGDPARRIVLFSREPGDLSSVTRAWFTLVWAGVPGVQVMLGGLSAWLAAGRPLAIRRPLAAPASTTSGAVEPEGNVGRGDPSAAEASGRPAVVRAIGADELHAVAKIGTVLDARPAEHFAGFVDDPRSGHVPGATSAPAQQLLGLDGALLPAADLRRWLLRRGAIGGHRVAAYCHGGVASSTLVFAGALLGQPIDLYVDSWSAWSRDPARPVVRGSARGRSGDIDFSCFADSSAI